MSRTILRTLPASLLGVLVLAGCGQKGDLYLPTTADARYRATLPQTLVPGLRGAASAPTPNVVQPAISQPFQTTPGLPDVGSNPEPNPPAP